MRWLKNSWRDILNNKLIQKLNLFFRKNIIDRLKAFNLKEQLNSFLKWLANDRFRWFWVLFSGILTIVIVLGFFGFPSRDEILNKLETMVDEGHAPWTLITIIIGAPTAFVIWAFRDHNNRMQIENQRKDINLKDFQKLSEWASGLHIPEKKIIQTNIENFFGTERTKIIETFEPLDGVLKDHPSLHDGAVALQIAAIYQLEAYLRGDYGNSFRRPAFQLLKSLWQAFIQSQVDAWENVEKMMPSEDIEEHVEKTSDFDYDKWVRWKKDYLHPWSDNILDRIKTPFGLSLNLILCADSGKFLRDHAEDLPDSCFAGLNLQITTPIDLKLKQLDLTAINLQCAQLTYSNFQGAKLNFSKLQGAHLEGANLQGAELEEANFQGANLEEANLQDAYLEEANLQGANLLKAKLQGALFYNTKLHGTILRNVIIDKGTYFINSVTNKHTIIEVGDWVGGKFIRDEEKSKALREQMIEKGLTFVDD